MREQLVREEFRNKMTNRFQFYKWSNITGTELFTSISINPGWYELLWNTSMDIEMEIAKTSGSINNKFIIYEVYQKYGGMTFRNTYYNDSVERILLEAEDRSNGICEVCGQCGNLREERSWTLTLCAECSSKRNGVF